MSTKPFLFQFSHSPDGDPLAVQEGVEAALMAVAFEQPVTLLFRGEGRVLLDPEQRTLVPGLEELLELVEDTWVEANQGDAGGDAPGYETTVAKAVEADQCAVLLNDYPVVMQF